MWVNLQDSEKQKKVKRGSVHGVGAGKFKGHYYPVNIGPRADELKKNLLQTAADKQKRDDRKKEKV